MVTSRHGSPYLSAKPVSMRIDGEVEGGAVVLGGEVVAFGGLVVAGVGVEVFSAEGFGGT